jgi:hypothetical protein
MVARIKPNPTGKDRNRHSGASAAQLGAEWVDIQNTTRSSVSLDNIELYHLAYSGRDSKPAKVMGFSGALGAGQVVRVHSGQVRPISVLRPEDLNGADHHLFTGRDSYVWNNAEGDSPGLWNTTTRQWVDSASYEPHPPEGVVLVRSGNRLVPQRAASHW